MGPISELWKAEGENADPGGQRISATRLALTFGHATLSDDYEWSPEGWVCPSPRRVKSPSLKRAIV